MSIGPRKISKSSRSVLQIVPFRTSRPDGIGDYALGIAGGLLARHGIATTFLSGTPSGVFPAPNDDWSTHFVAARTSQDLLSALHNAHVESQHAAIILHVGGYGYARRGVPLWLLNGLRSWRTHAENPHVFAIFHELYATGRPWNSSFWLGPLQRHVARQLWRLADGGMTTNSNYHAELVAWRPEMADRTLLMPVTSTVGEPETVPLANERPNRAAVFGAAGIESRIYGAAAGELLAALAVLGIDEIVDIGGRRTPPPAEIGGIPITALGRQPAEEVSRQLRQCRFGVMDYDTARLGKSTVFAAYAAHGVVPVCIASSSPPADGLRSGEHLLQPPIPRVDSSRLARIQAQLSDWYDAHSTVHLVDAVARVGLPTSFAASSD